MAEYTPVPEGHYRHFLEEYELCRAANIPREKLVANCANSLRHELRAGHQQRHFLLERKVPLEDLVDMFKMVERDSMVPRTDESPRLMPYIRFTAEECKDMNGRAFYEKFYKEVAERILFAEIFQDKERYQDMAKWIKNHFDRFILFTGGNDVFTRVVDEDLDRRLTVGESQAFMSTKNVSFVRNLAGFIGFFGSMFGSAMHPVIHLGVDAPVYTEGETKALKDRFYNCLKGVNMGNFRKELDGGQNDKKLMGIIEHFREHCSDPNPEELMKLAETANNLYSAVWQFMYQGAPRQIAVLIPRWVPNLQEEFAGNWKGSCHPLLRRWCNATAFHEESVYIDYARI